MWKTLPQKRSFLVVANWMEIKKEERVREGGGVGMVLSFREGGEAVFFKNSTKFCYKFSECKLPIFLA